MSPVDARRARVHELIAAEPAAPADAHGMVGALRRLCGAAVRALPASGAGLSVMTDAGMRGVAAASDEASERIDELQFDLGEGPCVDAFTSRRPVLEADLAGGGMSRWPLYSAAAQDEGVRAAFAFPLQIGAARLGVLDFYRQMPGSLTAEELAEALTFADVATSMLLDAQDEATPGDAADGLDEAMEYRFELHQAQGMIMVQLGVSLTAALALLRAYAYSNDRHLADVARDVVTRTLRLDDDDD
jgi:GAF domain/ANTAR domain